MYDERIVRQTGKRSCMSPYIGFSYFNYLIGVVGVGGFSMTISDLSGDVTVLFEVFLELASSRSQRFLARSRNFIRLSKLK